MRERTTWNRNTVASALKKIAEDPRAMNQDHLQQQPAADAYLIGDGSPSEFAEDVHSEAKNWKAEYGADGETSRNEIGMPNMRGDTFTNSEKSPGESAKRAAFDVEAINKRAELTTDIARLMCKGASESVIEDQAFDLMDMPVSSLKAMYQRLAAQQGDDEEEDEGDEGQGKEASDEEDEDEGDDVQAQQQQAAKKKAKKSQQQDDAEDDGDKEGQEQQQAAKKAGQVPPEFLEQQKKMKDKAKDKDESDDDKGQDKEAVSMAKSAATSLLAFPEGVSRNEAAKVLLLPIYKHLAAKQGCQDAMAQQQLLGQVQQMVQQAMQQQMQSQQQQGQQQQVVQQDPMAQQQMLSDEELVDQMLMDQGQGQEGQMFLAEGEIEMEVPNMDVGDVVLTAQDQELLGQVFASSELSDAMEAAALQGHHTASVPHSFQPQAQTRTASTRTVGTRPTAGVANLGGASNGGGPSSSDEINTLTSLWNSAPDVSQAF